MAMLHEEREEKIEERIPNGEAAAAIFASGVGCLAMGVFTLFAEASTAVANALNFYGPVGPLSGKSTLAVAVWLVAWVVLHLMWRKKDLDFDKVFWSTLVLIGLSFVLTFPKFFELFAGG